MLILTRKIGEKVYIGKNKEICITLVDTQGTKGRIGIDAPKEIPVIRDNAVKTRS